MEEVVLLSFQHGSIQFEVQMKQEDAWKTLRWAYIQHVLVENLLKKLLKACCCPRKSSRIGLSRKI